MNPYILVLLITLAIVLVVILIIVLFPKFHTAFHEQNEKTNEEIAKDEVTSMIYEPQKHESQFKKNLAKDNFIKFLEKREKELNIIFTEEDIESLFIQMKQDKIDDLK